MKIYCDTDTLFHNVKRQEEEPKTKNELLALQKLLDCWRAGTILMFRSLVNLREIERTKSSEQLGKLRSDYDELPAIPKDERFYGTDEMITDPYGGRIRNPLVADVQDEDLFEKLVQRKLSKPDAQHITQAVCNECDVFLTRDEGTIIKPHRRWIEAQFPPLRVRTPSELMKEIGPLCPY